MTELVGRPHMHQRRRETKEERELGPMEPDSKRAKVEPRALSEMAPFYVGVYADDRSWGTRVHELIRYGYGETLDRWSAEDFHVTDVLGHGYFGNVLRASASFHPNEPTQDVALKLVSKAHIIEESGRDNTRPLELLRNEVLIHSSICHRNILPFHGFHEDPENFSLVLALAPHGDVTGWIQADERPRAVVAPLVVSSVARALSYLHQHRIAHRDIKPENILVVGPVHFCLGDFGWACMGNLTRSTFCGTPEFLAPEIVVSPCPYDAPSVDLWALGVLMYELVYGSTPFAHKECRDDDETRDVEAHKDEAHDHDNAGGCPHSGNLSIFWKIRSFREPVVAPASPLPAVMDAFTEATVLDFCSQLMKISPAERMKPDEALQHPLLQTASLSYDADATTTTTPPCVSHSGTSNAAVTASPSWSIGSSNSDSYQTPRRSSGVALTYE